MLPQDKGSLDVAVVRPLLGKAALTGCKQYATLRLPQLQCGAWLFGPLACTESSFASPVEQALLLKLTWNRSERACVHGFRGLPKWSSPTG